MRRTRVNQPGYLPQQVSLSIIQQALSDMKQYLIEQINIQACKIFNQLLNMIGAKFTQQLSLMLQQNNSLQENLGSMQSQNQKITAELQHFFAENEVLRSQLEIINGKNSQYLEEMNKSRNQLFTEQNTIYQQEFKNRKLQAKLEHLTQDLEHYKTQNQQLSLKLQNERQKNSQMLLQLNSKRQKNFELVIQLQNLEQNLIYIKKKFDQQHSKYDEISSNLSYKEKQIKQLKQAIQQSRFLERISPEAREKGDFKIFSEQHPSFQGKIFQNNQEQKVKLSQSVYPQPRELLCEISGQQIKKNLSKESNVLKKRQDIRLKKKSSKVQKQKIVLNRGTSQNSEIKDKEKKVQPPKQVQSSIYGLRSRLNTIFVDRVKYRVGYQKKMQTMKCQLNQKEKQCDKLRKLLQARSSQKNSSSFLKRSFEKSRTISKNSKEELKPRKKQSSNQLKHSANNKSASENMSQSSQISHRKIIQNSEQFEMDCSAESNIKKQDQFQEFDLSPQKMRHPHYLNSEIDVCEDISIMYKNSEKPFELLSDLDSQSRANDNSLLNSSLQIYGIEKSIQYKISQIQEVQQNKSPTPLGEQDIQIQSQIQQQDVNDFELTEKKDISVKGENEIPEEDVIDYRQTSQQESHQCQEKTTNYKISTFQAIYKQQFYYKQSFQCQTEQNFLVLSKIPDFEFQNQPIQHIKQDKSIQISIEKQQNGTNTDKVQYEDFQKLIQACFSQVGVSTQAEAQKTQEIVKTEVQWCQVGVQTQAEAQRNQEVISQSVSIDFKAFASIQTMTDQIKIFQPVLSQDKCCSTAQPKLKSQNLLNIQIIQKRTTKLVFESLISICIQQEKTKQCKESNTDMKALKSTQQVSIKILNKAQPKLTICPLQDMLVKPLEVVSNLKIHESVISQKLACMSLNSGIIPQFKNTSQNTQRKDCLFLPTLMYDILIRPFKGLDCAGRPKGKRKVGQCSQKEKSLKAQDYSYQIIEINQMLDNLKKYSQYSLKVLRQQQFSPRVQPNSARTRSSSHEILPHGECQSLIKEIVEQSQSNTSKQSQQKDKKVQGPQNASNSEIQEFVQIDQEENRIRFAQLSTETYKQNAFQKISFSTANSNVVSAFKEAQYVSAFNEAQGVSAFKLVQQQPNIIPVTQQQLQTINNYFYKLKSYQHLSSICYELQKDWSLAFAQDSNMFVFNCVRKQQRSKFAVWRGKVLHLDSKVQFMEMPKIKQIKTSGSSLILGNSQFTLIKDNLKITQKNKIKMFRGKMTEGQWKLESALIYKTQSLK